MNMQKYASYKSAAKRIVRLMNEERELKKEAGLGAWLSKAWNYNFGPSQDGGQVTFYNNASNIKRIPESRFIYSETDNPYKTGPKLAPFNRLFPTFLGGTFGDIYDETARLDKQIRENRAKRNNSAYWPESSRRQRSPRVQQRKAQEAGK